MIQNLFFFALQLPCDKRTWRDTDLNFKVKKEKERRKKKEMSEFVDKEFIVALALTDTVYDAQYLVAMAHAYQV